MVAATNDPKPLSGWFSYHVFNIRNNDGTPESIKYEQEEIKYQTDVLDAQWVQFRAWYVRNRNAWPVIEKTLRKHFGQLTDNSENSTRRNAYRVAIFAAIAQFIVGTGSSDTLLGMAQKLMNWGNAFISEYCHFIILLVAILLKMVKNEL